MSAFNGGPAQTQSLNVPVGATPISTWANLPDPSTIPGLVYRVTDFGVAGVGLLVISDGMRWLPLGTQVLARSSVASSITGTTAETVLATVTVPPGLLGLNGGLDIRTTWSITNNANTKNLRARFGGVGGTVYLSIGLTASANFADIRRISNRNSQSSQIGSAPSTIALGNTTGALITSAADTSQSQDLVFTGQPTVSTDTATLEAHEVLITP